MYVTELTPRRNYRNKGNNIRYMQTRECVTSKCCHSFNSEQWQLMFIHSPSQQSRLNPKCTSVAAALAIARTLCYISLSIFSNLMNCKKIVWYIILMYYCVYIIFL